MTLKQAAKYLTHNYPDNFRKLTPETIKRWYQRWFIDELSPNGLDSAVKRRRLPQRKTRKRQSLPDELSYQMAVAIGGESLADKLFS